jgi:hypothetical protein
MAHQLYVGAADRLGQFGTYTCTHELVRMGVSGYCLTVYAQSERGGLKMPL